MTKKSKGFYHKGKKIDVLPMIKLFAMGLSLEEIKHKFPNMKEDQMKDLLGKILNKLSFKS